jgi:hypothetical protein
MAARRTLRLAVAATLLFAMAAPGCQGPRGGGEGRPTTPYSAYRPRFDRPPRRTLFLGGYAGYNYGPVTQGSTVPTVNGGDTWAVPVSQKNSKKAHDLIR